MLCRIECQLDVYRHTRPYAMTAEEIGLGVACGDVEHAIRRRNMLVDAGFEAIRAALVGAEGNPVIDGTAFGPLAPSDVLLQVQKVGQATAPTRPTTSDNALESTPAETPVIFVPVPDGAATNPIQRTLNAIHPAPTTTWTVQLAGLLPVTDLVGETLTEEGLFINGDKLFARALLASQATGDATFSGQPTDADTLTLDDGFGNSKVFEFDDDVSVTPGNVSVTIGATVEDTIDNLVTALAGSGVQIDGLRNGTVCEFTHQRGSAAGNQAITDTSAAIAVTGMSGGTDGIIPDGLLAVQFTHTIVFNREP